MSKTRIVVAAIALIAGGVLLIAPQLIGRNRSTPSVESKTLSVEVDESFKPSAEWLTSYTLTERSGKKFDSKSFKGKVYLVNFFFTSCPTACPLQTEKVKELDREFGEQGLHALSITCDPATDTPAKLQLYANKYNADPQRWLFLTGDLPYIRRVAAEVYWSPLEQGVHREDFVVVDKWGTVRGRFPWNTPDEVVAMKKLVTELLAETEPPEGTASNEAAPTNDSVEEEADSEPTVES